jgi:hypothetical protein
MTDQERPGSDRAPTTHEADDTQIEHEASANQVRDEPVPASHDDDRGAAARRNEEAAADTARHPAEGDQDQGSSRDAAG